MLARAPRHRLIQRAPSSSSSSSYSPMSAPPPAAHALRRGSAPSSASASAERWVEYDCDGTSLCALVVDAPQEVAVRGAVPAVLVAHTAIGVRDDFVLDAARRAAKELGAVAVACDLYGARETVWDAEDRRRYMAELQDRNVLLKRMEAALELAMSQPGVDKAIAFGYCLGGKAVLDLARGARPEVLGVVSFHGILDAPALALKPMSASVLACHGSADPFIPEDQFQAFLRDMADRDADVQILTFLGAKHAFTRPEKTTQEDDDAGFQYAPKAATRSWDAMKRFFIDDVLAQD